MVERVVVDQAVGHVGVRHIHRDVEDIGVPFLHGHDLVLRVLPLEPAAILHVGGEGSLLPLQ
jgi:hypothetical protein